MACSVSERLVVAADFKPQCGSNGKEVANQVIDLAEKLAGTGVYIKVNSALRYYGYDLIRILHELGVRVFVDMKFNDIPNTLRTDGELLQVFQPELVTVMCTSGRRSLEALKQHLPSTELLGVTVLTHFNETETQALYGMSIQEAVSALVEMGLSAGLDGFVCSSEEVGKLRRQIGFGHTLNVPGIRLSGSVVAGDDQNPQRVMTPVEAIRAGANRIIVGRPITDSPNPLDVVEGILEEIRSSLEVVL